MPPPDKDAKRVIPYCQCCGSMLPNGIKPIRLEARKVMDVEQPNKVLMGRVDVRVRCPSCRETKSCIDQENQIEETNHFEMEAEHIARQSASDKVTEIMEFSIEDKHYVIDTIDADLIQAYRWSIARGGYLRASVYTNRVHRVVFLHRIIAERVFGVIPPDEVDHENRNSLDNRRSNLRLATRSQNQMNTGKMSIPTTSRFKGVSKSHRGTTWMARIMIDRKSHYLGSYKSEEDAALAYDRAARTLFGEFACVNGLPDDGRYLRSRQRLTEKDVLEIRRLANLSVKKRDIARQFNVSATTITNITKGKRWSHIT